MKQSDNKSLKIEEQISKIPQRLLEKEGVFDTNYAEGDAPRTGTLKYYLLDFFKSYPEETIVSFEIDEADMTRSCCVWTTNFVLVSVLGSLGGSLIWVRRNPRFS